MGQNKMIEVHKGIISFSKKINTLVVPYVQREYRWEKKDIEYFIKDMYDEYQNNKEVDYVPTIGIIYTTCKDFDDKKYKVFDGQQRITTLLILCKTLGIHTGIKLEAEAKLYNDIINSVFCDDKDYISKNKSPLWHAYNQINKYVNELKNGTPDQIAYLKNLPEFIEKELNIIQLECETEKMAVNTFIKLNSRGKELYFVDLVKSFLFQNMERFNITEQKLDDYSEEIARCNKTEYNLLNEAYTLIIKSYIKYECPSNNRDRYECITNFLEDSKNRKYFFNEWIDVLE